MSVPVELIEDIQYLGSIFADIQNRTNNATYKEEMDVVLRDLEKAHMYYYAYEVDASGMRWAPLRPYTVKKKGHAQILWEHGPLMNSLISRTGDSLRESFDRGLTFGTDVWYAHFHVTGTRYMPARPPVGITEELIDDVVNRVADDLVEAMKYTI